MVPQIFPLSVYFFLTQWMLQRYKIYLKIPDEKCVAPIPICLPWLAYNEKENIYKTTKNLKFSMLRRYEWSSSIEDRVQTPEKDRSPLNRHLSSPFLAPPDSPLPGEHNLSARFRVGLREEVNYAIVACFNEDQKNCTRLELDQQPPLRERSSGGESPMSMALPIEAGEQNGLLSLSSIKHQYSCRFHCLSNIFNLPRKFGTP